MNGMQNSNQKQIKGMNRNVLTTILLVLVCSCSSEKEGPMKEKQDVSLTIGYTLINSGSMTKSTYSDFYDKYINSRVLTPCSYSISFKNIESGDSLVVNGLWENKDFFTLKEGNYEVKGTSYPMNSSKVGYKEYIVQDTVSLCFNEKMKITKDMNNLLLKANYDCCMILFDNANIKDIYLRKDMTPKVNAYKLDNVLYLFIRDKKILDEVCTELKTPLYIERKDGSVSELWINKFNMEKGKYYYFENINGNYELSPMENGGY